MARSASWRRRGLRAATFALVLVGSAVLGHMLAGGMLPARSTVLGAAAVLAVAGWWLARSERSTVVLATSALVGQLGLHLTFALTMPGSVSLASMVCGHRAGVAALDPTLTRGHVIATASQAGMGRAMTLMLVAHAVGGLLVLLALRSLESVAATVAAALRAVLRWVAPPVSGRRPRRGPLPPTRTLPSASAALLLLVSPRRGPPGSVCS